MKIQSLLTAGYQEKITSALQTFFEKKKKESSQINLLREDGIDKLLQFALKGKMIRGSLVLFSYTLFNPVVTKDIAKVAAAIEIMHSSLLIHDDIMDQDRLRRGFPTLFAQYEALEKNQHVGESMAICIGDSGFFLGYELLSEITSVAKQHIIPVLSREMIAVTFAQMQDVVNGLPGKNPTEEDILHVYTYKTGRYTIALPLIIGALLAQQDKKIIIQLEKLGEDLGILFQLKDDELGLFGSEAVIGKPVGSDIRENKKTLYWLYLFTYASDSQRAQLQTIFGREKITTEDLSFVYDLINRLQVKEKVAKVQKNVQQRIEVMINALPFNDSQKQKFFDILLFSLARNK